MPASVCLACVVTPEFVPGGLAMLHSFLKHNRWFDGDILVLQNGLSVADRQAFQDLWPRLRLSEVSTELQTAVANVVQRRPDMRFRQASFYKGDLLRLQGHDRVIYSDSDMIYTGSIEGLVQEPAVFQACGDISHYRQERRRKDDYMPVGSPEADEVAVLQDTFSAGFFVATPQVLGDRYFAAYLATMERFHEGVFMSGHTDQAILNILFDGQLTRLDCTYNYHMMIHPLIRKATGKSFRDAVIVHYSGWSKPWNPGKAIKAVAEDEELRDAFGLWRAAYAAYLRDAAGAVRRSGK